jgi:hypothetical protein
MASFTLVPCVRGNSTGHSFSISGALLREGSRIQVLFSDSSSDTLTRLLALLIEAVQRGELKNEGYLLLVRNLK